MTCSDCENLRRLLEELTAENTRLQEENTELRRRLALYANPNIPSKFVELTFPCNE